MEHHSTGKDAPRQGRHPAPPSLNMGEWLHFAPAGALGAIGAPFGHSMLCPYPFPSEPGWVRFAESPCLDYIFVIIKHIYHTPAQKSSEKYPPPDAGILVP